MHGLNVSAFPLTFTMLQNSCQCSRIRVTALHINIGSRTIQWQLKLHLHDTTLSHDYSLRHMELTVVNTISDNYSPWDVVKPPEPLMTRSHALRRTIVYGTMVQFRSGLKERRVEAHLDYSSSWRMRLCVNSTIPAYDSFVNVAISP